MSTQPHDNTPADWDARYAEDERMWSGDPNGLLVAEADALPPARAIDVGCGEGADAIWLAERGWAVTAVDVSRVAIDRGRAEAERRGIGIDWVCSDIVDVAPRLGTFDLVSAFYPVLRKDSDALEAVLSLVAPRGTLLFVHHEEIDRERALSHGFDPDDFVAPADVAALLAARPAAWEVLAAHEVRDRDVASGAGAHHHKDGLVRAVRRG